MKTKILEKDEIEQSPESWDQYFADVKDEKQEAGKETSQGGNIPDWAKKGLSLDALKGKNADQRWEWLKKRIETVLKDKQVSKVEEIKGESIGGVPGYRLLWKEEKTETGDQQDKSGNVYKIYYTEMFKGNPGTWIDKKEEGGKPGGVISKGYWGQNSETTVRVSKGATGSAGATGSSSSSGDISGVPGGVLWIDEPEKSVSSGGTGDIGSMKLIDLFASTETGKSILTAIMGDAELLKSLQKKGKIDFTDSPATVDEIDKEFTPEQKEVQKKNIEKLEAMGQKATKPDFKLISSPADFKYKSSSLDLSWGQVKDALEESKVSSKMDFKKWNIVGIRNSTQVKNQYQNRFTDLIVLMSPEDKKEAKVYPATTTPGLAFAYVPYRNWWLASALKDTINPNGLAILQSGVYDYKIGSHRGYTALNPSTPSNVGRIQPILDPKNLRFETYEPSKKETGNFGINIHKALEGETPTVDSWSAGCQVFKNGNDFKEFMSILQGRARQDTFQYALISSSDLGKKAPRIA